MLEENKTQTAKLIKSYTTTCILVTVLCVSLYAMGTSLGWFATNIEVEGGGMQQYLRGYAFPIFSLWTYSTEDETSATEKGWKKWPQTELTEGVPMNVIPESGLKTASFELKKLQFGTIDNLVRIKDDNKVFLRFDVTPENAGDPFSLWISAQTKENEEGQAYPFSIYDNDAELVLSTETVYEETRLIIEGNPSSTPPAAAKPLFNYFYARSETKYDDPSVFEDNLEFEDLDHFTYSPSGTGTYYVYVRIQPILDNFAAIAEPLTRNGYMPCFILYDFNVYYTVKNLD